MRNRGLVLLSAGVLTLVSCGSQQLALPSNPIDRAATCAVVSAVGARLKAPDVKGDLDFDAQTRIIHYAMLAGSEGKDFSAERASAVVARMSDLQPDITNGKWQDLVAPCDQAYPAVKKTADIELPSAKFDAELGCYSMSDFLVKTVNSTDPRTQDRFSTFLRMNHELDGAIGSGLKARGATDFQHTKALKGAALARMTKLGAPAAVMSACTGRFV